MAEASGDLTSTSEGIGEIVSTINAGEGTIGKLVRDDELYLSLVSFVGVLQTLTAGMEEDGTISMLMSDPALYHNLVAVSENIKNITDNLARGEGALGRLLSDEELYANLQEAVRSVNLAAQGIEEQTPVTVLGTILGLIW